MKLVISRQSFQNCTNIKFHENPFIGGRVLSRGQASRHDEANSRLPPFCECAWNTV